MNLSKDQLTVVVLVALLAVGSMALTPALVFGPGDSGDPGKTGDIYTTSGSSDSGPSESFDAETMMALPDDYTKTTTTEASAPPEIRASAGAQTMSVTVTEQGGDVALTLEDDRVHQGRWVSIPRSWFERELGTVPSVAYIQHSSGSKYQSQMHVRAESVAFYVQKFSSNNVTFSGSVEVAGNYTDGSQVQYDLGSLDSTSDPVVEFTGYTNTEQDKDAWSGTSGTASIESTLEPTGPDGSGDPVIGVKGSSTIYEESSGEKLTYTFNTVPNEITGASLTSEHYTTGYIDSYYAILYVDGSEVANKSQNADANTYQTLNFDITRQSVSSSVTVEVQPTDGATSSNVTLADTKNHTMEKPPTSPVEVTGDGQSSVISLTPGTWETTTLNLSAGDHTISINGTQGSFEMYANYTEYTETTDAAIEVNGNWLNHSGTLADGATASFTGDSAWLIEGTNRLNVSVGDGSLSSDAPTPMVGVNYTHDATDKHSVEYSGGQWTEAYNVSETYASNRSTASLSIPFQADIYAVQNLEAKINDTSWSAVDSSHYALQNTNLSVDLDAVYGGDIPAGTTMAVRTTGVAVDPANATVTVTEVTPPGESLNSSLTLDSWSADASLDVSSTEKGDRVHYVTQESWSDEDAYVRFQSDGTQRIHMDAATSGDTLRVKTLPLTISPETGDVNIRVPDDQVNSTQPIYKATPGDRTDDSYDVTFLNAQDGEDYVLWSETHGLVLDSGTASSPLTLTDDDDDTELIQFQLDTGTSSSSSGGGGGGGSTGIIAAPTTGGDANFVPLLGIALIGGLVLVAARNDGAVADAGSSAAAGIEARVGGLPVVGPVVGKTLGGLVETLGQLAEGIAGNQTVALSIVSALLLGSIQGGIIEVPQSSLTPIVVAGIGIYSLVALREFGKFTTARWAAILAATTLVTLQTLSEQSFVTAIVESRVWPILALATVYMAWQAIKTWRQGEETRVVIDTNQNNDDEDDNQ